MYKYFKVTYENSLSHFLNKYEENVRVIINMKHVVKPDEWTNSNTNIDKLTHKEQKADNKVQRDTARQNQQIWNPDLTK